MDIIVDYQQNQTKDVKLIIETLQQLEVQQHFRRNVQEYSKIIIQIFDDHDDKFEFVNFLKNENIFHKHFVDYDEFHSIFFNDFMPIFVSKLKEFDNDQKFFESLSKCIQKWIINKNIKSFDCYLTGHSKENCTDTHNICKILTKYLVAIYKDDNAISAYKLIFNAICLSYNNNFNIIYRFLILFIEILGFDVKKEFNMKVPKSKVSDPILEQSLAIIAELLKILPKVKVDQELKINEISFHDFLKNILQSIICTSKSPNKNCYNIIVKIIEIDPLIIENLIDDIIIFAMLGDNKDIMEDYSNFLIKVIEVFAKLHRIQNFVSKLIPTLKNNLKKKKLGETVYLFRSDLSDNINDVDDLEASLMLPVDALNYFTSCITNLASWQIINLMKTMIFHLKEIVGDLPGQNDKQKLIYLEILSILISWLLSSVRMAEHTVTSTVVDKFVNCLEEVRNILKDFGNSILLQEYIPILMRSFLNICYNWAEIYIILAYYSVANDINIKKTFDNDLAPCNIVYIHDYLAKEQWYLISERVTNFGGKQCKLLMQKLILQKLRAMTIFDDLNEETIIPIIKEISINFDSDLNEILLDRYVLNTILDKLPSSIIINLCEFLLTDLVENSNNCKNYLYDNILIIKGFFNNIFLKINKCLKQKRKLEEEKPKKAAMSSIFSTLPSDLFFDDDFLNNNSPNLDLLNIDNNNLDVKINGEKILNYLTILRKLPLNFCSENDKKIIFLLLIALHVDIMKSNCGKDLKETCETLVIGIVQSCKFNVLDIVDSKILVKIIKTNFEKSHELYYHLVDKIFRNNDSIVDFLKNKLEDPICVKCAIITLNVISKIKRSKLPDDTKSLCLKYKASICKKLSKMIMKNEVESNLIEPYAILLKIATSKDKEENYDQIKSVLNNFIEFSINNVDSDNLKGCLMLFTTVLNNKSSLEIKEDVCLRIWNSLKLVTVGSDIEEYSQLIILMTVLIPNEQFANILTDLFEFTEKSITNQNYSGFFKHLKTWQSILSCNINPIKTKVLHEHLEKLLKIIILTIKSIPYNNTLLDETTQFLSIIIQRNQLSLTSDILDSLLVYITVVITIPTDHLIDFVNLFKCSMSIMHNLIKSRNPLMMDRLPPYLIQYRLLLKGLCKRSNTDHKLELENVGKLADCAHQLEKLTKNLVTLSANDLARISPYLIADILVNYESVSVYPDVKRHLNNCVYSLLSLCDQHSIGFLMRVLSDASNEIFRLLYDNYKKSRFTGKV